MAGGLSHLVLLFGITVTYFEWVTLRQAGVRL